MYRLSIELQRHEWKFERTRNAAGTRTVGSFFEFSQTFKSVSISFKKHRDETEGNNLFTLIIKM